MIADKFVCNLYEDGYEEKIYAGNYDVGSRNNQQSIYYDAGETLLYRMTALLCTMLLFYGLGQLLYHVLNYFDSENEKRLAAENALLEEEAAADGVTELPKENIG